VAAALIVVLLAWPAPVAWAQTQAPGASRQAFRVALDAGHGGSDPGAISSLTGLVEKDVTLRVAQLTGAALRRRGVEVVYTRTSDQAVPLGDRVAIAERAGATLLVSVHLNSAPNAAASGTEAWYGNGARDADLAGAVLAGMAPALRDNGVPLRGTRFGPQLALLRATVPATLIELGYLSNPREVVLLSQPAFLERLADGIAAGIVRFRGASGGPTATASRPSGATPPLTELYFVRPGDTLGTVAARFRTAVEDLLHLNPVSDPQRLLPGSALTVPSGGSVVASWTAPPAAVRPIRGAMSSTYVVAPGETLSEIAAAQGLAVSDLARWNGIDDPRRLLAGQSLRLRPSEGSPAPKTAAAGPAAGAGTGASPRRYRVRPGDTLSEVAQRHAVTVAALLAVNPLSDPDRVLVGTTLVIPAATRSAGA
jgi:N-acetylmuramoyl-L-alanine amidase